MFHVKTVNLFFQLCRCGYHHNRVDDVFLAAGTPIVLDGLVAVYLRYYDLSSPQRS
jgi:hypothetical protein